MTAPLYWLTLTALMTALLAVPYVVARLLRIGLTPAMGANLDSGTSGSDQPTEKPAVWGQARLCRASQCVGNAYPYLQPSS